MIGFYARPETVEEALQLRQEHPGAVYAAGTTDVAVKLYSDKLDADGLIDLTRITALRGIDADRRVIGALTTFTDILRCAEDTPELRLMKKMAANVAATQVRNRGTLGGNLCNANPSSDSAPVLSVLNAVLTVRDGEGERRLPLYEFLSLRSRGDRDMLLTEIAYEPLPEGAGCAFTKIGRRTSLAIARINACAALTVRDGALADVRLCLGAVARVTGRFSETEKALTGLPCTEETILLSGELARAEAYRAIGGRASAEYKLSVIPDLVPQLLRECLSNGGIEL